MSATILIAEDSPTQAQWLATILAQQGHIPIVAGNGQLALEEARRNQPALVISDILMPEMNGYQLCTALKRDSNLSHIPVILLTSLSDPNDIIRGLQAGADGYVTKPFDIQILLNRINIFLAMEPEPLQLPAPPLDVFYAGRHHRIYAERRQMLSLLLGVYEDAVQQNKTLIDTQLELKRLNENLEDQVATRTLALKKEINQRKQVEEELREERAALAQRVEDRTRDLQRLNTELAYALHTRENFLAMMSHELRTPLNAVLGLGEVLQEGIYGELNEQQREAVRVISESGSHLLNLINDILDLSKISANKLELVLGLTSTSDLCRASAIFVRQAALKKNITLVEDVVEVNEFYADDRRLKQILVNLLTNAVKFTPAGGKVGLEVTADAATEWVQFVVWDTGQGIAPEDLKVIFNPFMQVDNGLNRQYEGTGLGLTMVEHLVTLHHGQIEVESEQGHGSRFTVKIPWLQQPLEVPPAKPAAPLPASSLLSDGYTRAQLSNIRLLLVEDSSQNFQTMQDYLTGKGFTVDLVRDSVEVVERAWQTRPDLIVVGIQLSKVNGLEVIRQLKAHPELSQIPVVAVTAFALPGDRERCLEAGATEYFSKPLPLNELMSLILGMATNRDKDKLTT